MITEGGSMECLIGIKFDDFVLLAQTQEREMVKFSDKVGMIVLGESRDDFMKLIQNLIKPEDDAQYGVLSPDSAAEFTRKQLSESLRRHTPRYSVNAMIGGYGGNLTQNTTSLYYVERIPSEQAALVPRYAAHGCGSTFVLSVLEEHYQHDMSLEEGQNLLARCVMEIQKRLVDVNLPVFTYYCITAHAKYPRWKIVCDRVDTKTCIKIKANVETSVKIRQIENKDSMPSREDIVQYVIWKYANQWREVGLHLGFNPEEKLSNRNKDNKNQIECFDYVMAFSLGDRTFTWRKLENALITKKQIILDPSDGPKDGIHVLPQEDHDHLFEEILENIKSKNDGTADVFTMIKERWRDVANNLGISVQDIENEGYNTRDCCIAMIQRMFPFNCLKLLQAIQAVPDLSDIVQEMMKKLKWCIYKKIVVDRKGYSKLANKLFSVN